MEFYKVDFIKIGTFYKVFYINTISLRLHSRGWSLSLG